MVASLVRAFAGLVLAVLTVPPLALPLSADASAQTPISGPVRILFINPAPPEDKHWGVVTDVMRAAAADLNVELEVQNAFHSAAYTLKHVTLATQRDVKPHYIIFRNVDNVAIKVFQAAHYAGINTITIDAPLHSNEIKQIGGPREKVSTWLGQVVPDAATAGESLVNLLVREVQGTGAKGVIEVVAMSGPEQDIGSQVRVFGLKRGISKIGNARLLHAFPGDWDTRVADREAYKAFRHAASSPIWWVADDNMALGVINVLRNTHRKVGTDTFVGAFHWTEPMMTAILQNKVQYVAGGHFIQGAAALILAHDHARGRDFADLGLNHTMDFSFLYRKNVAQVGRIMIAGAWDRIDFRRFSRAANPALQQYDFNVNSYLKAVLGQ
ncbi:MAG: substrate-binding domain-containing protein [Alphaproteobacteria bacterium]|nr:substrate-binding domain-containing protein [Alphaproteobacteria bacterium]MBO6862857.1 substrate-binding domain-containing protein [Alphaproteobacteria bacterium]